MEEKTYNLISEIEGKEVIIDFRLRKKFTVDDLDVTRRLDSFFSKIQPSEGGSSGDFTKEDFKQFLADALIPEVKQEIPIEFFGKLGQPEALEVFQDFFLVYLKLSRTLQKSLLMFAESTKKSTN